MNIRHRLLIGTNRVLSVVLALLVAGTTLAFGGAVGWARLMIGILTFVFALAVLLRIALEGRMQVLKSPLSFLGVLALGLAVVQLAPLPAALAGWISPRSHEAYTLGFLPERIKVLEPSLKLPEPKKIRTPVSLDRAATVRWLAGATACLALFWGVSLSTDCLARLYVVWGSIIAVFFLNTAFALVQLVARSGRLYGLFDPGMGPWWAPSVNELLTTPNATALRAVTAAHPMQAVLVAQVPDKPFWIGSLPGGPGAYLALGTLGLPLALALLLQLLAPRGSREQLRTRLGDSGQGGLVGLLIGLLLAGAVLVGLMAGPLLCLPFAIGLLLVGLPSAWPSGLRWLGLGLTLLPVFGLALGTLLGHIWASIPDVPPPVTAGRLTISAQAWADAVTILRDFPILGTGLGSFASIDPFYKTRDEAQTTALSSLVQWGVESGLVGLTLLGIGLIWCLYRLPGAVRKVGTADRALAFGLIGAAVGFGLFSAVHWTVELTAVAVAASALGGTWDRWLAGGTDLFVERG